MSTDAGSRVAPQPGALIQIQGVSKWFAAGTGERVVALDNINLEVTEGTFTAQELAAVEAEVKAEAQAVK